MNILQWFKSAPALPVEEDEAEVKKLYKYWRLRIFYGMYIGYVFYYFTRKSFTSATAAIVLDLHLDKADIGLLGTIFSISYGLSKFLSGIFSDRSNPRYFMAFGLMATGVLNILFGSSSSMLLFAIFWGLNGWFQGWGWPPCARLLTHWYSPTERGTWWGFWNSSQNVGGALIPLLVGLCAQYLGWRYGLWIPGIFCIGVGLFLINRLRDTPESLGLPSIEKYSNDYSLDSQEKNVNIPFKEILLKYVFCNPYIWLLGIAYFFVYVIRTAINDWSGLYLVEAKGWSIIKANGSLTFFEIGGILGSLFAGWSSDKIFKGRRGPVNVLSCVGVVCALLFLWIYQGNSTLVIYPCLFFVGFFIFSPQMLIGMAAAELSHKKAAGAATGFVGLIAYLGAAFAGYPVGKMTQIMGWWGFFAVIAICAGVSVIALLPLWGVKPSNRKVEPTAEKEPAAG